MATWHNPAERGQGLGCGETDSACPHGLVLLPWPLQAGGSVSRPPAEGAAPWVLTVGWGGHGREAGGVIHAGSPRHSQGPLPCASPEHQEWMNQSRLIRAFHAKPAQMTDLETAWSCSFSGFLRHAPEQAQVFIISTTPFDQASGTTQDRVLGAIPQKAQSKGTSVETPNGNTRAVGK